MAGKDSSQDSPLDGDRSRQESAIARAGNMLERGRWAARHYGTYPVDQVERIVAAVAEAAFAKSREYAEWAVRETGFGVVEDKVRKNEACSRGIVAEYAGHDYVSPRVDAERKIVEVPRPAGVVLALTPSTNPVATTYFKILLSLMTRNAVVVSPHPMAKEVCLDAARTLAAAAEAAGAPAGIIQCVEEPTIPLIEALMKDERTGVIVATGGTGVVRSAYSSGNPALGVGPGNVPVLVDASADIPAAAQRIVESKAFDNSVLCTNESVLIVEDAVADQLLREMQRHGAHLLTQDETNLLSDHMFPYGRLNVDVVGKSAVEIAKAVGIKTGPKAKVLLAPIPAALPEVAMTHEKLSPVLGVLRVPHAQAGITAARSIIRIGGAGHSAAVHSSDPGVIMEYAAQVPVLRVVVNVGNSTGSSGLDTNLAPSMTIGTGFVGRSAVGANLEPRHLVDWARIAYNSADSEPMAAFAGLSPWVEPTGGVPAYPYPSNDPRYGTTDPPLDVDSLANRVATSASGAGGDTDALREEIRRLVLAELSNLVKG